MSYWGSSTLCPSHRWMGRVLLVACCLPVHTAGGRTWIATGCCSYCSSSLCCRDRSSPFSDMHSPLSVRFCCPPTSRLARYRMLEDLQLDLDVYQGPFDLLFSLILREEVDILEVAVLDVILAYLERQAKQDDANWESASEFLVLVSSLLELKSRVLLPKQETGEGDMDPGEARERLLERLVSYARFKKAAEALAARRLAERYHWLR